MSIILGVKPDGNKTLFEWMKGVEAEKITATDPDGSEVKIRYINGIPLNDSNSDIEVNFLECWVTNKKGKKGTLPGLQIELSIKKMLIN